MFHKLQNHSSQGVGFESRDHLVNLRVLLVRKLVEPEQLRDSSKGLQLLMLGWIPLILILDSLFTKLSLLTGVLSNAIW